MRVDLAIFPTVFICMASCSNRLFLFISLRRGALQNAAARIGRFIWFRVDFMASRRGTCTEVKEEPRCSEILKLKEGHKLEELHSHPRGALVSSAVPPLTFSLTRRCRSRARQPPSAGSCQVAGAQPGQAILLEGDVTDPGPGTPCCRNGSPKRVLHLAARAGTGQSLTEGSRHASVNVVGHHAHA